MRKWIVAATVAALSLSSAYAAGSVSMVSQLTVEWATTPPDNGPAAGNAAPTVAINNQAQLLSAQLLSLAPYRYVTTDLPTPIQSIAIWYGPGSLLTADCPLPSPLPQHLAYYLTAAVTSQITCTPLP